MKSIFNILNNQSNNYSTIQNCRADIIGELEAIIQYNTHLEQTDNEKASFSAYYFILIQKAKHNSKKA